jgi:hypothetical protein
MIHSLVLNQNGLKDKQLAKLLEIWVEQIERYGLPMSLFSYSENEIGPISMPYLT